MIYTAAEARYDRMSYSRCGKSGLQLPRISLGLWHNFGSVDIFENSRALARRAFDLGITHFDLANNYGPAPGTAEECFGAIMNKDFRPYRDEMIISTKAGFRMWPGPYGEMGSRKNMLASLDQSLRRMGLDYVDILYSHRFDPQTPLEETMGALDSAVRQGKALYVGISNYDAERTARAAAILKQLGTPCLIHQGNYSMFRRTHEEGLLDVLEQQGIGAIAFSPLAKGMLTDRYLEQIPPDSRAAGRSVFLKPEELTEERLRKARQLNEVARERGQTLAQMALVWVLRKDRVTSALIGASKVSQIEDNVAALEQTSFTEEELARIDRILEDESSDERGAKL